MVGDGNGFSGFRGFNGSIGTGGRWADFRQLFQDGADGVSIIGITRDGKVEFVGFRSHTLASLSCVDYVVLFGEDTTTELLAALKPNILVKGAD